MAEPEDGRARSSPKAFSAFLPNRLVRMGPPSETLCVGSTGTLHIMSSALRALFFPRCSIMRLVRVCRMLSEGGTSCVSDLLVWGEWAAGWLAIS